MSDNNRRNYNPNAPSFVPNVNAMPFIPGQGFVPPGGQPPPFQNYGVPPPQQHFGFYNNPPQQFAVPPPRAQFGAPPPLQHQQHVGNNVVSDSPGVQTHYQIEQPVQTTEVNLPPPPPTTTSTAPNTLKQNATPASWDDDDVEDGNREKNKAMNVEDSTLLKTEKESPIKAVTPKPEQSRKQVEAKPEKEKTVAEDEIAAVTTKFKSTAVIDMNRKEQVNIVFIGHVDAGKSTIGGQIMYLTGMVDKRTLEKYEREAKEKGRESWYLSWALDTNDEEREKGKTVEVGRAFFETEKKHFTILDAPGHKSFVPNMICGATQADLAVLVISARKGEFETGFDRGGQTREHALLVKCAGVKHLIILVNKMDDPTVGWDEARYKEIQDKLTPYLKRICGFNPKTDIFYIPCSGLSGEFLKERPADSICSWYTGPCLLDYIDNSLPILSRDFTGPVRMIIADKYSEMGTIINGKLESGVIVKGQNAVLMPNRTTVQVLQCSVNDAETDQVYAGDNIKLKLKGVEESDILSGFVLCSPESVCRVARIFDAEVLIIDLKSIISSGYSCVLHIHTAVEDVCVKKIICTIDKKSGEKAKAKFVKQDEKCIIRLESPEAFCLETFDEFPQMARFTLRDEGKTIAIGKVIKLIE